MWALEFGVKDPNFITSHVHLTFFVLRIMLEVFENARRSSQYHKLTAEINIERRQCIVCVERFFFFLTRTGYDAQLKRAVGRDI